MDVAVTSNDELLVVNTAHYCKYIYRFTLDGNYINNLSSHGVEIRYPQSVRVDHNNFILVTELGDQQVVIAT